jgi:alpha-D-ribose 1-methylphosphonate 5-triphosphate synthase subunit PhnH
MEAALDGGFSDASVDAAHAFRAAMSAMARPGRIERLGGARPPAPLSVAAGTLILTLCDPETPVHLAGGHDTPEVRGWIAFHTGAPVVPRAQAAFAVGRWEALLPLDGFRIGEAEYPDRSATLIVEMAALAAEGARLAGPGIRDAAHLSLPETEAFRQNARLFPLGLDFFLTADDRVAALPRTARVT